MMQQFESQNGGLDHWSENIWTELNSINDKRNSLERILSSKNIHSPTSNPSVAQGCKKGKAPVRESGITFSSHKGKQFSNEQISQNSILDRINSDFSITSFHSFEDNATKLSPRMTKCSKSIQAVLPIPRKNVRDDKSIKKRNKRPQLVSSFCESQRKNHLSKNKYSTERYKKKYTRHDETGQPICNETRSVESHYSQKMNNDNSYKEEGLENYEQNALYDVISVSRCNEKPNDKKRNDVISETQLEDRKEKGRVKDDDFR